MYLNVWIVSHSLVDRCLFKIPILKRFPHDQFLCACIYSVCLTCTPNNELSPVSYFISQRKVIEVLLFLFKLCKILIERKRGDF